MREKFAYGAAPLNQQALYAERVEDSHMRAIRHDCEEWSAAEFDASLAGEFDAGLRIAAPVTQNCQLLSQYG